MRGSLTLGGGEKKANPPNFGFVSHYKKFILPCLPHPNKGNKFAFSLSSHLNKEYENRWEIPSSIFLSQTYPKFYPNRSWLHHEINWIIKIKLMNTHKIVLIIFVIKTMNLTIRPTPFEYNLRMLHGQCTRKAPLPYGFSYKNSYQFRTKGFPSQHKFSNGSSKIQQTIASLDIIIAKMNKMKEWSMNTLMVIHPISQVDFRV